MQPIWKLAGYTDAYGMCCNPRMMLEVEESLLWLTPVDSCLFDAQAAAASEIKLRAGKVTAIVLLSLIWGIPSGCGCNAGVASHED
jgi:hypothetical protein